MKRKILSLFLCIVMILSVFALSGCNKDNPSGKKDDTKENAVKTALDLQVAMGNGTNLANTMEAYGRKDLGITAKVSDYETFWGQPETTKEIIQGMKDSGFDSLRIPVAWTNQMNFESGDYTIADTYLDRVGQIIEWAIDADMYVVVNDHWDGSWWGMFGSETQATRDKAMDLYTSMWTQIAERYKDYDNHLIFESANEELGDRLNDVDVAADSGALSKDECYETTNKINQKFVDTIRATGGNNAERFLLIAGYNTDIEATCDDRYVMPTDTVENKLLVSVHYYTPWNYCGANKNASWGTEEDYNLMNTLLKKMTKFTDKGYGVIIGEYAALAYNGNLKDNTAEYTTNFLDNCDKYGYCSMLWDANDFYKRIDGKIINDEIAAIYSQRSNAARESKSNDDIIKAAEEEMAAAIETAKVNDANKIEEETTLSGTEEAIAWIMWNGSVQYSVGDVYNPNDVPNGLKVTDAKVDGAGTYTVALDFTGTDPGNSNGFTFAAIGLSNGELLYPGYIIDIKEILINGEPYTPVGTPYTSSDDHVCTRVNLYNGWVSNVPDDARAVSGNSGDFTPTPVDNRISDIKTISITFDYVAP